MSSFTGRSSSSACSWLLHSWVSCLLERSYFWLVSCDGWEFIVSKRPGDPGYASGWCIHFRSMGQHETCEKGVRYDSFSGEDKNMTRMPCFTRPDGPRAYCEHRRLPTAKEIADHEEWVVKQMDKLAIVMKAIAPWRKKWKGVNHGEVIECPICKGRLQLMHSGINNHIHGSCHTEGCVAWME